jgi:hypothetical protein
LQRLTEKIDRTARRIFALAVVLVLTASSPLSAADLEPRTVNAFDHYIQLTESQIDSEQASREAFLWVERLPANKRSTAEQELRSGKVVIERLQTLDGGKPIACPGGMIHHWMGTVFIPGATLAETLSLVQDYDQQQEYFRPDVVRSKIFQHDGADYLVYLRFYKKKIVTSVVDTEHQVHYSVVDATHASSRSRTTRIQQVDDAGKPDERLRPVGHDDGFLWRMNTYWRFEQKNGGTYVECQSISLTRDIPTGLGWLIGPFVTSVPRESLTFTLATTRSAVLRRAGKHAGEDAANKSSTK